MNSFVLSMPVHFADIIKSSKMANIINLSAMSPTSCSEQTFLIVDEYCCSLLRCLIYFAYSRLLENSIKCQSFILITFIV